MNQVLNIIINLYISFFFIKYNENVFQSWKPILITFQNIMLFIDINNYLNINKIVKIFLKAFNTLYTINVANIVEYFEKL